MSLSTNHHQTGPLISLLWLFAALNILFRDIHEMTMAGTIEEILKGQLNGNPVTEGVLLAGAFAVELLLLSMLLSSVLPRVWARRLNIISAPLMVAGIFLAPPNDPDDYFFAAIVLGTFFAIFVIAWRWREPEEDETNIEPVET